MGFRLNLGVGCVSVACAVFGACAGKVDGDTVPFEFHVPEYVYSGACSGEALETECGEDCAVTADFSVRCDIHGWAQYGPRVAPRSDRDGAYLAVTSSESASFIALERGAAPTFAE